MQGVTIGIGDVWKEIAEVAAARMCLHTGLKCSVIQNWPSEIPEVNLLSNPSWLKLWIQERLFPGEDLLIFDADLFCVRDWDPVAELEDYEMAWVAEADSGFDRERTLELLSNECRQFHLPVDRYGNGGFLIIRSGCKVLQEARKFFPNYGSWLEQTGVNQAVHDLKPRVRFLPPEFNFIVKSQVWLRQPDLLSVLRVTNLHLMRMKGNLKWFKAAKRILSLMG